MLWQAVVLLGRHWPALLMISLFGSAAHDLLSWSAVTATKFASPVGVLVLALVPLSLMVALILMMRTLRPSLPYLARVTAADGGDRRGLMAVFASVAVPFLTIYTTYDYLKDDVSSFTYEVWRSSDPGEMIAQLPFSPTVGVICIVVLAVVLRALFNVVSLGALRFVTQPLGAYAEVVWLSTLTMAGNQLRGVGWDWLDSRRAGEWWHTYWAGADAVFQPIRVMLEAFWHNIDVVVFAPIAWLALGTVVYGRRLTEPSAGEARVSRWADQLPQPFAFIAKGIRGMFSKRFGPLVNGLRLLGRAGLRPMLIFCVAFVVLQMVPQGIWEIERALIGPHDLQEFWMPLSYLTAPVNSALRWVLIICLVAAATDRILATDPAKAPAQPSPAAPPPVAISVARTAEAQLR